MARMISPTIGIVVRMPDMFTAIVDTWGATSGRRQYPVSRGCRLNVGDYVALDSKGYLVQAATVHAQAPTAKVQATLPLTYRIGWLGTGDGDDEGDPPATARSATAVASPPPPANCQRCGEPNAYGAVANYPAAAPTLFRCWSCRKYHGAG